MRAHVWRDHVVPRHLLTFLSAADVGRLARVDRLSRRAVARALRDFRQRSARLSLSLWVLRHLECDRQGHRIYSVLTLRLRLPPRDGHQDARVIPLRALAYLPASHEWRAPRCRRGYMTTKASLGGVLTSVRWCVLADGVLRIYRHFGVTLATDTVDLSRTIEIKLVNAKNNHRRGEQWIAMEHMTRLYLLQSEHPAATKLWLKKLQAAVRFGGGGANNHDDSSGAEKSSS
ncbi:hypothetical protein P43SY_001677 [Pythium insidiosum]|uniref:PH domain-containing protein n=1 Tax=Pythium insidiosum TaxID=114742 RepID=A0AAD5QAG6_PYTIN|nr:hypothetical protein P43SY_001677 [Pythium insidiosum]